MRVFIAGATGAIGMPLVRQLVARDHQVIGTTRHSGKADELRTMGAEAEIVDGLDADGIGKAVARAAPDVIVHQMTALAGQPNLRHFDRWFAATNELRTRGTDHLLAAAQAAGVERIVVQSYTGWNNSSTGRPVNTEADPLDPEPAKAQRESMAAISTMEQAAMDAPLTTTVLRYGSFYGPGASEALVEMVRRRKFPIIGSGSGVWSWIHLDDAASATVAAVERAAPGIYNITDDEPAPVTEWLPYLADVVGAKPPTRVPRWLGRLLAGEVAVRMMTEIRGASNRKAKRELGWMPTWTSWRQGFREGLTAEVR